MLLKRTLVAAMAAVMLSGCGARGAAVVESPTMVLAAAVKATDGLSSYTIKFAATESFPLSGKSLGLLGSSGGSSAISGTFNGNFTGDLKVVKPDRVAVDATAKLNGISIEFSAIRIGADSYSRDLLSGAWKKSTAGSGDSILGNGLGSGASLDSLDPATMTDLLKYLSVDQTFADTDVDGAHVHHYRVKLDTTKLKDELRRRQPQTGLDASARARDRARAAGLRRLQQVDPDNAAAHQLRRSLSQRARRELRRWR